MLHGHLNESSLAIILAGNYVFVLTEIIVWFLVLFPSKSVDQSMSTINEINYGFVYIAHPRAVTNLSWRKTSKYMPK
jgi:hypothetical protein